MKKTLLIIVSILLIAIISFGIGYFVATWKWNCCAWGEPCERNVDPALCDSWLGFPQTDYSVNN